MNILVLRNHKSGILDIRVPVLGNRLICAELFDDFYVNICQGLAASAVRSSLYKYSHKYNSAYINRQLKSDFARDTDERNGWISLLATEDVGEAERLMQEYPWLVPIYADMADYIHRPEEVFDMYSEALRILDRNSMQLMVDEMKQQHEQDQHLLKEKDKALHTKDKALTAKDKILDAKDKEIATLKRQLQEYQQSR